MQKKQWDAAGARMHEKNIGVQAQNVKISKKFNVLKITYVLRKI